MADRSSLPEDAAPYVKILEEVEEYSFEEFFRIVRATLQFRRFDGTMSEPVTRITFERGDSVGVLLYDPDENTVVLVRQFRYPIYARLPEDERDKRPKGAWVLELIAGVQEEGRGVHEVAHAELLEEAGYEIEGSLQPITTMYPSPGGSSEQIHLFLAEVDHRNRTAEGGGVAAEGEDTQIVVLPLEEALEMVRGGSIHDAKTIVALQHLALERLAE